VIAIAEVKFVLKTSGENYKNEMKALEEKSVEEFIHVAEHAH